MENFEFKRRKIQSTLERHQRNEINNTHSEWRIERNNTHSEWKTGQAN